MTISSYQATIFLFDRVRAAATQEAEASLGDLSLEDAVREAVEEAGRLGAALRKHVAEAKSRSPMAAGEIERVLNESGILALVSEVLQEPDVLAVLRRVLRRHDHVHSGKFDKGLAKAPWLRLANGSDSVRLTAQRYQLPSGKCPARWTDENRHPYRTAGAFHFIEHCEIR